MAGQELGATLTDVSPASTDQSDWNLLCKEIGDRTKGPVKSFPFLVYVLIGIVLFGGLGIWAEILRIVISPPPIQLMGVITAVITFFPTLIGSTTLQLILASVNNNDKVMIAFALLILFLSLTAAILLPFFSAAHHIVVLVGAIACSLFSIWVWWITYGRDPAFHRQNSDASTGGPVTRELAGTLGGFRA